MSSAVTVGVYCVLTWAFCGAFLQGRGLYGETVFLELSQTRSWWAGFVYPYDVSRPFVSVPYQLAYLLSDGSYFSMNALFVLSVLVTGILTWRLVGELLPRRTLAAFAAGAIAIVHGADRMANFVPAVQVRQAVVAAAAAVLVMVIAYRRGRAWLMPFAFAAQALSLWTYEPGLLALLCAPALTWRYGQDRRRWIRWAAAWEAVPIAYVLLLIRRYLIDGASSYQASRLSAGLSIVSVAGALTSIMAEGLAFWRWWGHWFQSQAAGCGDSVVRAIVWPLGLGTVVAVFWFRWFVRNNPSAPSRRIAVPFAISLVFLIACALPFAPVRNVWQENGPWRTQFFVAVPAAVCLALLIDAIGRRSRVAAVLAFCAVIASGLASGLVGQLEEGAKWQAYRRVMAAMVSAVPRLQQDSMIVLAGVPTSVFGSVCPTTPPFDPFSGDEIWFNSGLQVLYPDTRLVGVYWTARRENPGSIQVELDGAGGQVTRATISVKGRRFRYDQMVAFAYDADRGAVLLGSFPASLLPDGVVASHYNPVARILPGRAPAQSLRKLQQ